MKDTTVSVFLILLCFCGALVALTSFSGQSVSVANPAPENVRVKNVVDDFFAAAKKQDWDAAGNLMSADFELYTDEAQSFDKEAYVRLLKKDDIKTTSMELKDLEIRVSSDAQMAWCKYRGFFEASSHGELSNVETAETLIFKKEGDLWKITRAHASVKPITAPQSGNEINSRGNRP
jgi:ketosteroid isomerase-like protein